MVGARKPLATLADLAELPFTTAADIRSDPLALLCVSQGRIARAVTLQTSGTTGPTKRIFFSPEDLALTLDFFHHGMATLVSPGQRVLILLPGKLPDSVGDLLRRALGRMHMSRACCRTSNAGRRRCWKSCGRLGSTALWERLRRF